MAARLIVLYPPPLDAKAFERAYFASHMPLMRRLVGAGAVLTTHRVRNVAGAPQDIYRVAEIKFESMDALRAYVTSDRAREGRASSEKVSTGGTPTYLICATD
ncbi:EthD family reductase [Bradyrhizobium lablabi]|uniref:EthD family reductase n=1 Tax=Bradyrhizobium lablabi TaxID=722472 RepID=UPI001BACB81E|nr:EthD family reductase [Bradyrhizobium lablabi]MBR1121532.1 EthD family reductase [Bradyrhizobium lablabi]